MSLPRTSQEKSLVERQKILPLLSKMWRALRMRQVCAISASNDSRRPALPECVTQLLACLFDLRGAPSLQTQHQPFTSPGYWGGSKEAHEIVETRTTHFLSRRELGQVCGPIRNLRNESQLSSKAVKQTSPAATLAAKLWTRESTNA